MAFSVDSEKLVAVVGEWSARQCQQFPGFHLGDLRPHRLQRERVEAPARRLLQQGTVSLQRAQGAQVRRGFYDKGRSDDVWGEGIRFQAVGLAVNTPVSWSQLVVLLPLGSA